MNKTELVALLAEKADVTKKDAEKVLSSFVDVVGDALKKGDKIQLVGFGTFEARKRAARTGKNPQTNAVIKIPATTVPAFKAGKALKDIVAGK
ncbi:MAG: HU family DNA-binding protein [Clostridia bacterium]|nr:HU family DNA-binding protein [Clostridia bacterium]MBR5156193.1 HU family DNA-binding protein [Clostridia bacterium]